MAVAKPMKLKFDIVVPSVAIREGVLKSIGMIMQR